MRILMKAVASTATVGLLAFGAVAGGGGSAFASVTPYTLITGCGASVADVQVGFVPNCEAIEGTIAHPNSLILIAMLVEPDRLSTLIGDQLGQGLKASWVLACAVNGSTVTRPGGYEITSTKQSPITEIDLQAAVGSPDPNLCALEDLVVQTIRPLNAGDLDDALPFTIAALAVSATAVPGSIYQKEGTTSGGAHADLCVDDTANGNAGTKIQAFQCLGDLADSFVRTSAGQLVHNGDCVSVTEGGYYVFLARCAANSELQRWTQSTAGGTVMNSSTGTCLTASSVADGTQLTVAACGSAPDQQWNLPKATVGPGPLLSSALVAELHRDRDA
jgi:Ricin-type beta-trefoil lectin domain